MATILPDLNDIQAFDYSVNLLQAILWQYNGALNLQGLLNAKAAWYETNQTEFWSDWYTNVFNLETADQFGLVVWSIILGLPLYVNSPPPADKPTWGFGGGSPSNDDVGFNLGNFTPTNGSSYLLPLATQRIALQLRAYQLFSSGTVPEINRTMQFIFRNLGTVWLEDYRNMTQAYIFNFPVTWDLAYIFNNFDILPRPAGVYSTYIDNSTKYFGFNSFNGNFNSGYNFQPHPGDM
jgi:Protein of unknown function (DUF2612)